jgi:hypothetical protein
MNDEMRGMRVEHYLSLAVLIAWTGVVLGVEIPVTISALLGDLDRTAWFAWFGVMAVCSAIIYTGAVLWRFNLSERREAHEELTQVLAERRAASAIDVASAHQPRVRIDQRVWPH